MKIKSVISAAFVVIAFSISTAWAAGNSKSDEADLELAVTASKRLCEEVTPMVGKAITMALEGKTEAQVAQFFRDRWKIDEGAVKFYPNYIDENRWIKDMVPKIMWTANDIANRNPGNKKAYALEVEGTKTYYLASCRDDFKATFLKALKKNR